MSKSNLKAKIFACTNSVALGSNIAKSFGEELGNVITSTYSDGEFQPSYEESIRGTRIFVIASTNPGPENLMELLLMLDAAKRASARHITAEICLADDLLAASIIKSNSIRFSELGWVEPIIKSLAPLTDSSNDGWNSPSL